MNASQERPIKEFAHGIFDGPHATPAESPDGGIFLGIKNITDDGHLDLSEIRYVSENDLPKWTRRVDPAVDDLVFTYEATLHRYALIPEGFRGCLGRRVALIRPDQAKVNPRFLLYYLLSPQWRHTVERFVITGATVDRIPIKDFPDFPVFAPPKDEQDRIASILSAYDDLIENNLRRIKLLEESARLLYREWFVRLRFPGHEHTRIVDGVPEGWEQCKLGDVADVNRASVGKNYQGDVEYVDISAVSPGSIDSTSVMDFRDAPSRARRKVQHGDVIWSCVRPNRRSHAVISHPPENLLASTGFAVLTPKKVPTSYLYLFTTTDSFVGYLTNHARGSAYPAVVASDFENADFIRPSDSMLQSLDDFVAPTIEQLHGLRQQNIRVRQARDILLPKLMNGEIAA